MKRVLAVVLITLACVLVLACEDGPITVQTIQTVTGPGPVPTPTPGPSPTPGACIPAATVRVGFFGFSCPPAVAPPRNGDGVLQVGCTGRATATPKERDGRDQNGALHAGVVPAWKATEGGQFLSITVLDEPFNVDLTWRTGTPPGVKARVESTVCGVTGGFEFVAQ